MLMSRATAPSSRKAFTSIQDQDMEHDLFELQRESAFLDWRSARGTSFLVIPSMHNAERAGVKIWDNMMTEATFTEGDGIIQYFAFKAWDTRYSSIESMLSTFLAEIACDLGVQVGRLAVSSLFREQYIEWNLEDLFLLFYDILLTQKRAKIVWILINLNENIRSYQWLLQKLESIAANSEFDLKVVFINRSASGPFLGAACTNTIHVRRETMNARPTPSAAELDAMVDLDGQVKHPEFNSQEDLNREHKVDPSDQSTTVFLNPTTLELIQKKPQLAVVGSQLNRLFGDPDPDPELRSMIWTWLSTSALDIEPSGIKQLLLGVSQRSIETVFRQVLKLALSCPGKSGLAIQTLELVTLSFRPFTTYELADLERTAQAWRTNEVVRSVQAEAIPSWLPGVLIIQQNEVHFSHDRLRDFILSENDTDTGLNFDAKGLAAAHGRIACLCLKYLVTSHAQEFLARYRLADFQDVPLAESRLDFLLYAVKYWPKHAKLAGPDFPLGSIPIRAFLEDREILDRWARYYWIHCNTVIRPTSECATPFAIFAEHGLDAILVELMGMYKDAPSFDQECLTALVPAAWGGETQIVRLLLDRVIPDDETLDRSILASVESANEILSEMLISKALTPQGRFTGLPAALRRATLLGRTSIVTLILTSIPGGNSDNDIGGALLQDACKRGSLEAVKCILDRIEKEMDEEGFSKAIRLASGYGHCEVSTFLVKKLLGGSISDDRKRGEMIEDNFESKMAQEKAEPGLETAQAILGPEVAHTNTHPELGVGEKTTEPDVAHQTNSNCSKWIQETLDHTITCGQHQTLQALFDTLEEHERHPSSAEDLIKRAISSRNFKCFKILLNKFAVAVPTEKGSFDMAALMRHALDEGDGAMLQELMVVGAVLNDEVFQDALGRAVRREEDALDLVELLVKEGRKSVAQETYVEALTEQLAWAVSNNREGVVKTLIQGGPDVEKRTIDGTRTPLYHAAYNGYINIVKLLLEAKADPNAQGSDDEWTSIHAACDHASILSQLITAGANINAKTANGATALLLAISWQKHDSVKELLRHEPDLDCIVEDITSLTVSVSRGSPEMVMTLLDAGTDPCHPTTKMANRFLLHQCVEDNQVDILRKLLLYNFQIEDKDEHGATALNSIRTKTTIPVLQLLINRGALINTIDVRGQTPLSKAVWCNNLQMAEFLISKGANVNARIGSLGTSLHLACSQSSLLMVKMLVDRGADINYVDQGQLGTLFQAACQNQEDEKSALLNYLLNNKEVDVHQSSDWWGSNLNAACLMTHLDMVESLIKRGVQIDAEDRMGRRPIHFALYRTVNYVECLLENGAKLFVNDAMRRTALHYAVLSGRLDLVKYILEKEEGKTLANRGDCDGWTPLFWAVRECLLWDTQTTERGAIIKELKAHGADIMAQGEGLDRIWTPYKLACYYGLDSTVVKLVKPTSKQIKRSEDAFFWRNSIKNDTRKAKSLEGFCDACLLVSDVENTMLDHTYGEQTLVGIYYACEECDNIFALCFKCYRSKDVVHPKHQFNANNLEEYVSSENEESNRSDNDENSEEMNDELVDETKNDEVIDGTKNDEMIDETTND